MSRNIIIPSIIFVQSETGYRSAPETSAVVDDPVLCTANSENLNLDINESSQLLKYAIINRTWFMLPLEGESSLISDYKTAEKILRSKLRDFYRKLLQFSFTFAAFSWKFICNAQLKLIHLEVIKFTFSAKVLRSFRLIFNGKITESNIFIWSAPIMRQNIKYFRFMIHY